MHKTNSSSLSYSLIIPAFNEERAIGNVLDELLREFPPSLGEVIVVDDCSTDETVREAEKHPVRVLKNIRNFGYGYSLKQGIKAANHHHIIIIDADGSYPINEIRNLRMSYEKGYDMVVGARQGKQFQSSLLKSVARYVFRILSEFTTGQRIPDINSGCRIFRKDVFERFSHTLSSGFSFTTTITLAFMLNAYSVVYVPIVYNKRVGSSKVRYLRDILRSLQIITEAIIYYNPIKLYLLCSLATIPIALVGIIIGLFSIGLACIFITAALSTDIIMSLGFAVVFMKFAHEDAVRRQSK